MCFPQQILTQYLRCAGNLCSPSSYHSSLLDFELHPNMIKLRFLLERRFRTNSKVVSCATLLLIILVKLNWQNCMHSIKKIWLINFTEHSYVYLELYLTRYWFQFTTFLDVHFQHSKDPAFCKYKQMLTGVGETKLQVITKLRCVATEKLIYLCVSDFLTQFPAMFVSHISKIRDINFLNFAMNTPFKRFVYERSRWNDIFIHWWFSTDVSTTTRTTIDFTISII